MRILNNAHHIGPFRNLLLLLRIHWSIEYAVIYLAQIFQKTSVHFMGHCIESSRSLLQFISEYPVATEDSRALNKNYGGGMSSAWCCAYSPWYNFIVSPAVRSSTTCSRKEEAYTSAENDQPVSETVWLCKTLRMCIICIQCVIMSRLLFHTLLAYMIML